MDLTACSGIYIINLGKTWEKFQLATRVIVAIENPEYHCSICQTIWSKGCVEVCSIQWSSCHCWEAHPCPLPIKEAALGNIPTTAFCDTEFWTLKFLPTTKANTALAVYFGFSDVDLFFYREPEEAKKREEEEAASTADYGNIDYPAGMSSIAGDWGPVGADAGWDEAAAPSTMEAVGINVVSGIPPSTSWD
ncbi:hypothetical protein Ancab_011898 [Ancistrocladus abbreviatus]